MTKQKPVWRWISVINMACIASVIDANHYLRYGTVRTWSGWQPAGEHHWAACFSILLDIVSVFGLLIIIQEAISRK